MKTVIKINGLDVEFSDKVPEKPGAYYFLASKQAHPSTALICHPRLWKDAGGLWSTSPLVPAVEVEKAYDEGAEDMRSKDINRTWADSRARAIAEGGE